MFKVAYCAGHYLATPGKRVPKQLDPSQTREWVLNDRVARYFNERMLQYEGVQTMRTDDSTGKKEIKIKDRTKAANDWGANFYLDIHHNAGAKLTNAGGVVAFSYPESKKGKQYRDAIYDSVVSAASLRGNRSKPKVEKALDSLKYAKAPAVLMEYGFMDSLSDYPVISIDAYSKKVGYATADAVASVAGLRFIEPLLEPVKLYCVQVGSYQIKDNAEFALKKAINAGFKDAFIFEKEV